MLTGAKPKKVEFLNQFFGPGNQILLTQVISLSGGAGHLKPWVELLLRDEPHPTVLPRRIDKNTVSWYGLCFSERQLKKLGEDLMSFIGPTYSNFQGLRGGLNANDSVDQAVQRFTRGAVYKFTGNSGEIWKKLELMREVWEESPRLSNHIQRPMGRVLRDFYMALRAGARSLAEVHLSYLKNHHTLDILNLTFLQVQMLAGFGNWHEMLRLHNLPELLQIRRPLSVTRALIQAIYYRELDSFEQTGNPLGAVEHFREHVLPAYGTNIFNARSGMKNSEILKCFMMKAVSERRPDLRDELLSLASDCAEKDQSYLQLLAGLLSGDSAPVHSDPLHIAEEASDKGDFDLAFNRALEANPSKRRCQILHRCAYELQTLEAEKAAVEAFQALPLEEQESLLGIRMFRTFWEYLTGSKASPEISAAVETVPHDWLSWLTQLNQRGSWSRATEVARLGSAEWQIADLLERPGVIEELSELMQSPGSDIYTLLFESLPYMLEFFQKDEQWPRREFLPIYSLMLDLLVMGTEGGEEDLIIFNDLVQALLTLGVNQNKYQEVLGYALELWGQYASPIKLNWALDLIDMLIIYPCPSEQKRLSFLFAVTSRVGQFARRMEHSQWDFLRQLHEDLDQGEAFEGLINPIGFQGNDYREREGNLALKLKNLSIALYTLTERVSKRVKEVLEKISAGVSVHISNDKVGNERLRQIARNADIFVIATSSAKHAATEFIEDNRSKDLPILRPSGKGSASMLQSIYSYLLGEDR